MKDKLTARLAELRREYDTGQRMLADLDRQRTELHNTLLRIAGAIQVLEEMLAEGDAATPPTTPDDPVSSSSSSSSPSSD